MGAPCRPRPKQGTFLSAMKRYQETKRAFEKTFREIAHGHPGDSVFSDFLEASTITFRNALPFGEGEKAKREKRYREIMANYTKHEAEAFPRLLAYVAAALEDNIGDFLGEAYMEMELGNKDAGQYFTPYGVTRMMAELSFNEGEVRKAIEKKGFFSVYDPACGAGATLLAYLDICRSHGINYQRYILVRAQDIDPRCARMCYLQVSLLGAPGIVVWGNSLTDETHDRMGTIGYAMQYPRMGALRNVPPEAPTAAPTKPPEPSAEIALPPSGAQPVQLTLF